MLDKKLLIERVFQEEGDFLVELPVCLSAVMGVGMGLSLRVKEMTTMRHLS
jgi:hypothetical protein